MTLKIYEETSSITTDFSPYFTTASTFYLNLDLNVSLQSNLQQNFLKSLRSICYRDLSRDK